MKIKKKPAVFSPQYNGRAQNIDVTD